MIIKALSLVFISTILLSTPAQAATVTLHGSTTVANNLINTNKSEIEAAAGHKLEVVANGSSNGLKSVNAGTADIAMISAPLEKVIAAINKNASNNLEIASFQAHKVGEARIAFTVHPANTVKALTLIQITHILNGSITNWRELGGLDAPILIVSEFSGGGLRTMVENELLDTASISGKKRELPNGAQIPLVVAQIPTSFGVMSAALLNKEVTEVTTDTPINQPLIFVTKGTPSNDIQAVINASKSINK